LAGSTTEEINPTIGNVAVDNHPVVVPVDKAPATEGLASSGAQAITKPEYELLLDAASGLDANAAHNIQIHAKPKLKCREIKLQAWVQIAIKMRTLRTPQRCPGNYRCRNIASQKWWMKSPPA
jgi:hypothetical protein